MEKKKVSHSPDAKDVEGQNVDLKDGKKFSVEKNKPPTEEDSDGSASAFESAETPRDEAERDLSDEDLDKLLEDHS